MFIIQGILLWIVSGIITTATILVGYIVVPLAAACGAYEMTDLNESKPDDGPIYHFTWKWMKPWDNWSDGIANTNYVKYDSLFKQIVYWSAYRNPANGLRGTSPASVLVIPSKVKYIGSDRPLKSFKDRTPHWFIAWQGPYLSVFWQFEVFGKLMRLWVGYKIIPQDQNGIPNDNYRSKGSTMTFQFKRVVIL